MILDLVVAGVLDTPPAAAGTRLPLLERLVARGDRTACDAVDLPGWLFSAFGLAPGASPPIAPFTLLADGGEPGSRYWLRADPVHLAIGRTDLVLTEGAADSLSAEDARTLAAVLGRHFGESGLELVAPRPSRWYVGCERSPHITTVAPAAALGRLEERHLPSGEDRGEWRRRLTEAQMLLHDHPVNEAREARGEPPINGVWIWGGGRLPATPIASPYDRVASDDALATGLARAAGVPAQPLPDQAEPLLRDFRTARRALAILGGARVPASGILEPAWLAPIEAALRDGTISELRLTLLGADRAIARRIARAHLRRWWRRTRPLAHAAD